MLCLSAFAVQQRAASFCDTAALLSDMLLCNRLLHAKAHTGLEWC